MNKKWFLFQLVLVGLVSFQAILIYSLWERQSSENNNIEVYAQPATNEEKISRIEEIIKNPELTERENIKNIAPANKDINDVFVTGWIPDWDMQNGLTSVQSNSFDGISPVFFYVNSDGTLKQTAGTNNAAVIQYAKDNNIELLPTITLFDTDIMSSVLSSPEKIQIHVDSIMAEVINNNYDGIDIDYESIYLKDKEAFFDFLEKLSLELAKENKKFSFTVLPKWGNDIYYESLPQTRMVQDYKRIADLTDEFRIMTYEFTARDAETIGPIAPVEWIEDVIQYTIYSGVPREKIVIGIHTYSYDYTVRPVIKGLNYYPTFFPKGTDKKPAALANFPLSIQAQSFDSVEFNSDWGESVGKYTADNIEHIVIFPNQESFDIRKELAAKYGIKGVAYWKVGGEGELRY